METDEPSLSDGDVNSCKTYGQVNEGSTIDGPLAKVKDNGACFHDGSSITFTVTLGMTLFYL